MSKTIMRFELAAQTLIRTHLFQGCIAAEATSRRELYVFTEQGVAILSSVLKSKCAIAVNIEIMRAFVRRRQLLTSNKELARQLKKLERKVSTHDQAIVRILKTIRELMNPEIRKSRPIGFTANLDEK